MVRNLAEPEPGPNLGGVGPRATSAAVLSIAVLVLPAAARADVDRLYDEYRSFGAVSGCAHSEAELRDGLAQIPADVRAYDPGFADALNSALEQRAASCDEGAVAPGSLEGGHLAFDGSPGPTPAPAVASGGFAARGVGDPADGVREAGLLGFAAIAAAAALLAVAGRRR